VIKVASPLRPVSDLFAIPQGHILMIINEARRSLDGNSAAGPTRLSHSRPLRRPSR
jgi:hypothetical protein